MPQGADDPRQVLAILNSLGFVGITAEQLKSFMKDLKLHRKIKESQREQWREETKKKIFIKQRQALAEIVNQNSTDNSLPVDDSSSIKIRIKCITESDTNDEIENDEKHTRVVRRKKISYPSQREQKKEIVPVCDKKERIQCTKLPEKNKKPEVTIPARAASAPELSEKNTRSRARSKSVASSAVTRRNKSRSSSRSQPKSFIRPWKLNQPQIVKSDPVMLYHKYQKEWKQKLCPGENNHAEIRWAVREKMLGVDPTPRPILKKSYSSISVKKR